MLKYSTDGTTAIEIKRVNKDGSLSTVYYSLDASKTMLTPYRYEINDSIDNVEKVLNGKCAA